MNLIRNETIRDAELTVDGKTFDHCVLERCTLHYSGGSVVFDHTVFRSCRYVFFGPARATVHFLEATGMLAGDPANWVEASELVSTLR